MNPGGSAPGSPEAVARAAGERAGVTVRALDLVPDPADAAAVAALCARIWRVPLEQSPAEPSTLIAFAHAGGYVGLAERPDGMLVGTAIGFPGRDETVGPEATPSGAPSVFLHSHIAGVYTRAAGSGVGTALKLHQRAWCLARGIDRVEWTFDPLIARNAHVNLTRLGAVATEYLVDFYGPLGDGLNAGAPTDRLLVRWSLADWPPRPPAEAGPSTELAVVPADAERLWYEDPGAALRARLALRERLLGWFAAGSVITFDRSAPGYRRGRP